ncbi:hypothetical protein [Paenibacillus bouchesdurhonensis]|uniref:hypothetical protein n=1 Tax=Paenibacillus bouchesdurhonensis TaxID=1870990 RepID=UPI000DA60BB8|nr:hypothetical protein [Paenibacillus bouchesdurhonensis]
MTYRKVSFGRGFKTTTLLLVISTSILLSGCANNPQSGAQETTPAPNAGTSDTNGANANNTAEQPNQQQNEAAAVSETEGLPSGVKVKKVIKDITLKNNYHKKIELLTDGGKRVTITDANGGIVVLNLEYEGTILEVNGKKVTVQVDRGEQQTITIPDEIVIEDDDNLGLNKGVEIEWNVDADGNIQSVELDD